MPGVYDFSEGFQVKILSLLARDMKNYTIYKELIHPKYFRKETHMDLCRIIHEHYDKEYTRSRAKGTDITAPTLNVLWEEMRKLTTNPVKAKLRGEFEDAIVELYNADLADAEYIKDSLVEFGRRSALEHAILDSVNDLEKGNDYSNIEKRIKDALSVGENMDDLGTVYFENAEERITSYENDEELLAKVPTGLEGLDRVLHGGLGPGELGVIIAPPNRGKQRVA